MPRYTIKRHVHVFAAWAASRAASVKGCRFSVKQGRDMLEKAGLKYFLDHPDRLPSAARFDKKHREWRTCIMAKLKNRKNKKGGRLRGTHGIAAKLINMYLKVGLVCTGKHKDTRVRALHPPIDGPLMEALVKEDVGGLGSEWQKCKNSGWSNFDSEQYEDAIALVRRTVRAVFRREAPLWKIEKWWPGNAS